MKSDKKMETKTRCELMQGTPTVAEVSLFQSRLIEIKTLVTEDNDIRRIFKCPDCGQLYLYEFHETTDWVTGEDPQYRTYVPVKTVTGAEQIAKKYALGMINVLPRLHNDWLQDGTRRVVWFYSDPRREPYKSTITALPVDEKTFGRFVWQPKDVEWIIGSDDSKTPGLSSTTIDNSLQLAEKISSNTMAEDVEVYRLGLFPGIKKGDMFKDLRFVSTTSGRYLYKLIATANRMGLKPIICILNLTKGMHGYTDTKGNDKVRRMAEVVLGAGHIFTAISDQYEEVIGTRYSTCINLEVLV